MSALPPIEKINTAEPLCFIEAIHILFEVAPPLATALLAQRPFASYTDLIEYAHTLCLGSKLSEQEKREIINAHPRIGESKTNLSAMSLKEQGYTPHTTVSQKDQQVNETLARLNKASVIIKEYEDVYGFKFVVFVAGRSRAQIIPVLQQRIASGDREKELETGLTDMMLIAHDRLKKTAQTG
ncbi:Oxo-4-hydroxy-4-carboxy-5-ureidoimidazoline decarboxylase [Spinellus fusiger]|nr:Oxo-4-hydroxy-4-carboxy-5-ureidoimidazoline decarboxylase [Spinellus fusiger]